MTASSWAAKQLSAQPERIGILLPNLGADVQQVARVINEALADKNCSTSVNITAGTKLSETPLVASALIYCRYSITIAIRALVENAVFTL